MLISDVNVPAAEFGPAYLDQFTPQQLAQIGIPEPASALLVLAGAAGLLRRRRRE